MCEESYARPRDNRVTVYGLSGLTVYEFYVVFDNGAGCSQASGPQYASTDPAGTTAFGRGYAFTVCPTLSVSLSVFGITE